MARITVCLLAVLGLTSTATATAQPGQPWASAAPPKLGLYAGIRCSDQHCSNAAAAAQAAATHCGRTGHPATGSDAKYHGHEFVCLRLKRSDEVVNIYYGNRLIDSAIHVSSDRFPETCNQHWCVSGEWFGTKSVHGYFRNPNHERFAYRAQLYSP